MNQPLFWLIISALAFFLVACSIIPAILELGAPENTGKTFEEVNKIILEVSKLQQGSAKSYSVELNKNTFIFGMNPGKDFVFVAASGKRSEAFTIKRPTSCPDRSSCICTCEGYKITDMADSMTDYSPGLECGKAQCSSTDVKFPSKTYMKDVFSVDEKEPDPYNGYWQDSFILITKPSENSYECFVVPCKESPDDVMRMLGYVHFRPTSVFDVTFAKSNEEGGVVVMCITGDCKTS